MRKASGHQLSQRCKADANRPRSPGHITPNYRLIDISTMAAATRPRSVTCHYANGSRTDSSGGAVVRRDLPVSLRYSRHWVAYTNSQLKCRLRPQSDSCARSVRKFNHLETNSLHKKIGNFQMYCREDSSTNRQILAPPRTSINP